MERDIALITFIQGRVIRVLDDSRVVGGGVDHVGGGGEGGGQTLLRAGVRRGLGQDIWRDNTLVSRREIVFRDLTVQYFKVIEVQPDIVNPEHGVVLTQPSLKVHVHQAGVL